MIIYDPTIDQNADPTDDPTADPTDDPTDDPMTGIDEFQRREGLMFICCYDIVRISKEIKREKGTVLIIMVFPQLTLNPARDPTIEPTTDPTFDATFDPTRDRTAYPTTDSTRDPTSDPTTDPTEDATVDPIDEMLNIMIPSIFGGREGDKMGDG